MAPSTLEQLQSLKDAEFHQFCDDLLPRISPTYHPLVPHGRNDKGDSIVGQPDSYVGDSAKTCRIAIQYTVQRQSWWSKAVEDVKDARRACPKAEEIVIALPRDVDREKPSKGDGVDWLNSAEEAAAPARLTVVSGRALALQLDADCQDLRRIHLGVPFSRLSWHALLMSCRDTTAATIDRLASLRRYDPSHYVDRTADKALFQLWQRGLRNAAGRSSGAERDVMIPLVADSGIGKTSLLAHFAERASPNAPLVMLLARDISFDDSDSLLREVMTQIQGAMDTVSRSHEEAHIAETLSGNIPLPMADAYRSLSVSSVFTKLSPLADSAETDGILIRTGRTIPCVPARAVGNIAYWVVVKEPMTPPVQSLRATKSESLPFVPTRHD